MIETGARDGGLDLVPLRSGEDWLSVREDLEEVARQAPPNPWICREHGEALHRLFWPGATVWLIWFLQDGRRIGAMLLKQESQGTGLRTRTVLRSLDAMVPETSSLWAGEENRCECIRLLGTGLTSVQRATGADLIRLVRQDAATGTALENTLAQLRVPHQAGLFTTGQRILLSQGLEAYLQHVGSRRVRDIRRRARKLATEAGETPATTRRRGDLFAATDFEACWRRHEALRLSSWQLEETGRTGKADPIAVLAYQQTMARRWSRDRQLEIVQLEVGESLAAIHLNVVAGDRVWLWLMNHDPRWRSYGAGMQLFLALVETGYAAGDRTYEMGGEANDWKADWANAETAVREVTIPLPSLRGRLWTITSALRR